MGLLVLAGVQAAAKIPHSGNEVINNAYCGYPLDITSLWQKEDTMLKISMSNKFQFRMMPEFRGLIWPQRSGDIHYIGGAEILPAPFTIDEEKEILDKLGGLDDQAARSSLIEHNLRLVVYIAKKFDNTGVGVEDLISIGTIGLIKEILMYLRRNNKVKLEVSIDEPLNVDWDGNELLLSDILGTDENVISKNLEDEVDRRLLRMALNKLSERERVIIEMRFGINTQDGKERTQKEVADIMGISQSYISRLEKKIMKRLKKEIMKME